MTNSIGPEIHYCGECGMPPEYCEYGKFDKCKRWLVVNAPDQYPELLLDEELKALSLAGPEESEVKEEEVESVVADSEGAQVLISTVMRGKKKAVTVVQGLEHFGHNLKDIAKKFKSKFASGSTVSANKKGEDIIIVQGDVQYDMIEFLHKKLRIPEDKMFYYDVKTNSKELVTIY